MSQGDSTLKKIDVETPSTTATGSTTETSDIQMFGIVPIKTLSNRIDTNTLICRTLHSAVCNPLEMTSYFSGCTVPRLQRICQICVFEGSTRQYKDVAYCAQHQICACLQVQPDHTEKNLFFDHSVQKYVQCTDWSWMCQDEGLSCWEKLHKFYIPNDLFTKPKTEIKPNVFLSCRISRSNYLYKRRKEALNSTLEHFSAA